MLKIRRAYVQCKENLIVIHINSIWRPELLRSAVTVVLFLSITTNNDHVMLISSWSWRIWQPGALLHPVTPVTPPSQGRKRKRDGSALEPTVYAAASCPLARYPPTTHAHTHQWSRTKRSHYLHTQASLWILTAHTDASPLHTKHAYTKPSDLLR